MYERIRRYGAKARRAARRAAITVLERSILVVKCDTQAHAKCRGKCVYEKPGTTARKSSQLYDIESNP
jgi:hypothetical protein